MTSLFPIVSRHLSRPGAIHRGALCLALLLGLAAGARAEDRVLPADTTPFAGLPPFAPSLTRDPEATAAWCAAAAELGRSAAGTRHGGDLLFSAGEALRRYLREPKRAAGLFREAAGTYPRADVTRGVLLTHWLAIELDRGNAPEATRLLGLIRDVQTRRPPRDADEAELGRWSVWESKQRLELPPLVARHHASEGRLREAAETLTGLAAQEADALETWRRIGYLDRAARYYYRAGLRSEAVRTIDAAIELTDDEAQRASLRYWRLYAKHGLLDGNASPRVSRAWPGEAFENDLRAYLRSIQGLEGVGTRYLSLGSRAYAAGRFGIALEIYLLGLRDPELVAEARKNSGVWRGLLMGYSAAMRLERFDEAEQILEIVERVADEPMEDKDAFVLALQKARRDVAERPLREAARRRLAEAKKKRAEREAKRRHRARMATEARGDAPAVDDTPLEPVREDEELSFGVVLLLLLASGGVVVALLALLRR